MDCELNYDDILCFPEEIDIEYLDNVILIISISSANWIVLQNEVQLSFFNKLRDRSTIGQVIDEMESEQDMVHFKNLLAAIFARKFAGVNDLPPKEYLEGYKMLNIYITNACNLRCEHCFMNSGIKLKSELNTKDWTSVLSDFKNAGGENVTFSGGEPLMYNSFSDILKYSYHIGLKSTILSNGLLWSDTLIKDLSPFINEIQFSIDGVDEDTNALVRGKNNFETVVKNVVRFSNIGVKVSVATTFTYENLNDKTHTQYKDFVSAIRAQSENEIFFKLSKKLIPGRNLKIDAQANRDYFKRIKEIEQFVDKNADFENFMVGHSPNLIGVNCGFGGISISSDGNVYFCNRISDVESYGNVLDKPISYFMEKGKQIHEQTSVDNIEPCKTCKLKYVCNGGCRIDDFNFAGKLKGASKSYKQITCTSEAKYKLMKRMIDSFNYLYVLTNEV